MPAKDLMVLRLHKDFSSKHTVDSIHLRDFLPETIYPIAQQHQVEDASAGKKSL